MGWVVADFRARIAEENAKRLEAPAEPYKSLYAFELRDANIFFGREEASEALLERVLKDRLTILYARSAAGKSSLLNPGLIPLLLADGRGNLPLDYGI